MHLAPLLNIQNGILKHVQLQNDIMQCETKYVKIFFNSIMAEQWGQWTSLDKGDLEIHVKLSPYVS